MRTVTVTVRTVRMFCKDYKQGGYMIVVELKNDPGIMYENIWSDKGGLY
jgi:hypothetical protein